MQASSPAVRERTGYALFDNRQVLVDANAEIFGGDAPARADFPKMDLVAAVGKILPYLRTLRRLGRRANRQVRSARSTAVETRQCAAGRGANPRRRLEAPLQPLPAGSWHCPGSTDMTEMKRAQIAHLENAEIFRCISESHPLPVWVVDEESKQILYESLDASSFLAANGGRTSLQYMTAHFIDPAELKRIRSLAGKQEIVHDLEIQLKRANGWIVWCSTNCRRGSYHGRRVLVIACSIPPSASSARTCLAS